MRKDRQDVIRKIQRLLQLAQSSNQHEAELALAKAQALMLEHELSEDEVSGSSDDRPSWVFVDAFVGNRRSPESYFVEAIVQEFFFCEIVHVRQFYWHARDNKSIVQIFGDERHAIVARYVFVFLMRTFKNLWAERKRRDALNNSSRRSYYYGLHEALAVKLRERQAEAMSDKTETAGSTMIRLKNDVSAALAEQLPDIKAGRKPKSVSLDAEGYCCGLQDGDGIQLRTPLGAEAAPVALING